MDVSKPNQGGNPHPTHSSIDDQAEGAQNSSISKSPLPSLSNFLKSFGMSSGQNRPGSETVVRNKKKKKHKRSQGKQKKTRELWWSGGLWRYDFVGCQNLI